MCVHACTGQWNLWLGCSGVCMSRDRHTCDNADYISYQMHAVCIHTTSKHAHNLHFHSKCPLLCVYIYVFQYNHDYLYTTMILNCIKYLTWLTIPNLITCLCTYMNTTSVIYSLTVKADHLECMNLDTIIREIFAKLKFRGRTKLLY